MEFDILFARTFMIVAGMLVITAAAALKNKNTDGKTGWLHIIGLFGLLFIAMMFSEMFPVNIILVSLFAALMGWMIAPTIHSLGNRFKAKKFFKERGIVLEKNQKLTEEQLMDLEEYLIDHKGWDEWNKIVSQAMFSTAVAVFATASLVFMSDIDFSFMGMFLFVALIILIVMGLLNIFVFKSRMFSLIKAYFGVLIFTGYLIYDFNTLEKLQGDESWSTAINLALNLYLDIINLFLYILQILSEG